MTPMLCNPFSRFLRAWLGYAPSIFIPCARLGIVGTAAALIAEAVIGATSAAVASNQAKKAAEAAQGQANALQYQKIDLNQLQQTAQQTADENVKNSLALEAKYQPALAQARSTLNTQIAQELSQKGIISPDVARQVMSQSISGANSAGLEGGAGPISAASLGMTAQDLTNLRQQKAANLLAQNPLPQSGLSPGDIASLEVAQTNSQNQFNVGKMQAQQNATIAKGTANAGMIAGIGGALSSAVGAMGSMGSGASNPSPYTPVQLGNGGINWSGGGTSVTTGPLSMGG